MFQEQPWIIAGAKSLGVPEGKGPCAQAELRWTLSWSTHCNRKEGRGFEDQWVDLMVVVGQRCFWRVAIPSE